MSDNKIIKFSDESVFAVAHQIHEYLCLVNLKDDSDIIFAKMVDNEVSELESEELSIAVNLFKDKLNNE